MKLFLGGYWASAKAWGRNFIDGRREDPGSWWMFLLPDHDLEIVGVRGHCLFQDSGKGLV